MQSYWVAGSRHDVANGIDKQMRGAFVSGQALIDSWPPMRPTKRASHKQLSQVDPPNGQSYWRRNLEVIATCTCRPTLPLQPDLPSSAPRTRHEPTFWLDGAKVGLVNTA